jgi:hypothetical protein
MFERKMKNSFLMEKKLVAYRLGMKCISSERIQVLVEEHLPISFNQNNLLNIKQ